MAYTDDRYTLSRQNNQERPAGLSAPDVPRRTNSHIDYDYLYRGAIAAAKDGHKDSDHPYMPEALSGFSDRQYGWAEQNITRIYARNVEDNLWFAGVHNLRMDEATRSFVRIESTRKMPRPLINLCLEKVESVTGDLLKGLVAGRVYPNSNDYRDIMGARAATNISRYLWEKHSMDKKLRSYAQGAVISGDMFTDTELDGAAETEAQIEMTRGDGTTYNMPVRLADVQTSVLMPVQIFANPGATDIDNAQWIHTHVLQNVDWIKENYPHTKDEFGKDKDKYPLAAWQYRIHELMMRDSTVTGYGGLYSGNYGSSSPEMENLAVLHKIQCKPSKYYPQGRLFIIAGSAVCYAGPLPLGKILMTHFRYTPIENSWWSLGLVSQIRPMNKHQEANFAIASLARRISAVPMFFVPERSGGPFGDGELKVKIGGIYKYKPEPTTKQKPELVQGRHPADAGFVNEAELVMELLSRVVGDRGVLQGNAPQGITAGVALRFLASRAGVRFQQKQGELFKCVEEMEGHRLFAVQQSPAWVYKRQVPMPGRTGAISFGFFRGADISDNFNYKLEATGKNIYDEPIVAQAVVDAVNSGFIPIEDPRNRMKALELMGLGDKGFFDQGSRAYEFAHLQLMRVLDGQEVQIRGYENPKVMSEVALDFMQTEDYLNLDSQAMDRVDQWYLTWQEVMKAAQMGVMGSQMHTDELASQFSAAMEETLPPGTENGPQGLPGGGAPGGARPQPGGPGGPGAPGGAAGPPGAPPGVGVPPAA